jgi:WD40 repeat protein
MDGGIYMIDLIGGKVVQTMRGHTKGVAMIGYCAENNYLVSGGIDHKLQVWNPHLDQNVGSLSAHHHQLIGLHVRPNSPEVITADASGMIKIWDMRKFAAVQTIVKELYVRDHNAPATRSMTAMCYIESCERIAIGHSSIFFLDSLRTKSSSSMSECDQVGVAYRGKQREVEKDEANKPLHVSFNSPLRMFLAITRRHVVSWDAATGSRVRSTPIPLRAEVTCVATMQDGYSCFAGCEDGSVARLMLPSAAMVVHKRVHKHGGEVSSIRLLNHDRLILTCGNDGNVIVSHWETLQVANILNHWRGLQSVHSFYSDSSLLQVYSVPLSVRSFFMGNEIGRLIAAFAQADPTRSGKIAVSALPSVLERAFPSSTTSRSSSQPDLNHCREDPTALTFAMFIDVVKDSLSKTTVEGRGLLLSGISAFDVHPTLGTLVTASSDEAEFCVWNLKNGAVMGDGRIRTIESPQRQSIAIVRYLHPLPFFVCVEDNSSSLSIWSSRALPPVTTLPNACILRYTHSHSGGRESLMSATTFLTEPNKVASDAKPVLIRSLAWFSSDNGKKLLCVGDEAGHIQLLDLQPVMHRIEEVNTTRQPSADPSLKGLLSASLLQKVHRWSTVPSNNIGVRFLHVQNIEYLMQPNASNHTVVVSMGDLGSVTLWSLDGQLLGRLQDEGVHWYPWKLCLDAGELQQKTRESAIAILRHVEKRQVTSLNQQEDSGRRRSPVSQMYTLSSNGTPHHSDDMPLQSSTTLLPSRPPGRRSTLSAEDKLVAWRQSLHSKPPIGLQSRRSLRVSTPQGREGMTPEPVTRPGSPPKEKELDEGIEDTTVEGADLGNPATIPDSSS